MNIFDRFLIKQLLLTLFGVLVFVLLFHMLIRIAEVGRLDWQSFQLMLFELPNIITLFFPIAILISGLLALGNMNSRNEITVMRANGYSRLRIGFPLLAISVISALLMIVMMEFLTPRIISKLGIQTKQVSNTSWQLLPEGYVKMSADKQSPDDITMQVFQKSPTGQLQKVILSAKANADKNAVSIPPKLQMQIADNQESIQANPEATELQFNEPFELVSTLSSVGLSYGVQITELWQRVSLMAANNIPHKVESNELWRVLLLPLTYLSVAMIVLPFVFSSGRNISTGKRLFIGIAIGLCFYVISRILGSLSLVYPIHSAVAISIAPMILIIATLALVNRHI